MRFGRTLGRVQRFLPRVLSGGLGGGGILRGVAKVAKSFVKEGAKTAPNSLFGDIYGAYKQGKTLLSQHPDLQRVAKEKAGAVSRLADQMLPPRNSQIVK
jgi:hypothetical protein